MNQQRLFVHVFPELMNTDKMFTFEDVNEFLQKKIEKYIHDQDVKVTDIKSQQFGRLGPGRVSLNGKKTGRNKIDEDSLQVTGMCEFSSVKTDVSVYAGKWMYEIRLSSRDVMQLGWCTEKCRFTDEHGVGDTLDSYGYDGYRVKIWNGLSRPYGEAWEIGDVITCCIDLDEGNLEYYRNGKSMGIACDKLKTGPGTSYYPAFSISERDTITLNFGEFQFMYEIDGYKPLQRQNKEKIAIVKCLIGYWERLIPIAVDVTKNLSPSGASSNQMCTSENSKHNEGICPWEYSSVSVNGFCNILASNLLSKMGSLLTRRYISDICLIPLLSKFCDTSNLSSSQDHVSLILDQIWSFYEHSAAQKIIQNLLDGISSMYEFGNLDEDLDLETKYLYLFLAMVKHQRTKIYIVENLLFEKVRLFQMMHIRQRYPHSDSASEHSLSDYWGYSVCVNADNCPHHRSNGTLPAQLPDTLHLHFNDLQLKNNYNHTIQRLRIKLRALEDIQTEILIQFMMTNNCDDNMNLKLRTWFLQQFYRFIRKYLQADLSLQSCNHSILMSFCHRFINVIRIIWKENEKKYSNLPQFEDISIPMLLYTMPSNHCIQLNSQRLSGRFTYLSKKHKAQIDTLLDTRKWKKYTASNSGSTSGHGNGASKSRLNFLKPSDFSKLISDAKNKKNPSSFPIEDIVLEEYYQALSSISSQSVQSSSLSESTKMSSPTDHTTVIATKLKLAQNNNRQHQPPSSTHMQQTSTSSSPPPLPPRSSSSSSSPNNTHPSSWLPSGRLLNEVDDDNGSSFISSSSPPIEFEEVEDTPSYSELFETSSVRSPTRNNNIINVQPLSMFTGLMNNQRINEAQTPNLFTPRDDVLEDSISFLPQPLQQQYSDPTYNSVSVNSSNNTTRDSEEIGNEDVSIVSEITTTHRSTTTANTMLNSDISINFGNSLNTGNSGTTNNHIPPYEGRFTRFLRSLNLRSAYSHNGTQTNNLIHHHNLLDDPSQILSSISLAASSMANNNAAILSCRIEHVLGSITSCMQMIEGVMALFSICATKHFMKEIADTQQLAHDLIVATIHISDYMQRVPEGEETLKATLQTSFETLTKKLKMVTKKYAFLTAADISEEKRSNLLWIWNVLLNTFEESKSREFFSFLPVYHLENCMSMFKFMTTIYQPTLDLQGIRDYPTVFSEHGMMLLHYYRDKTLIVPHQHFGNNNTPHMRGQLIKSLDSYLGLPLCTQYLDDKLNPLLIRDFLEQLLNDWTDSMSILDKIWKGDGFVYRYQELPHQLKPEYYLRDASLKFSDKPNPSKILQTHLKHLLTNKPQLCSVFINLILTKINWSFSEVVSNMQELNQNRNNRTDRLVDLRYTRSCAICFDIIVIFLRILEMIITLCPGVFMDFSRPNAELFLNRIFSSVSLIFNRCLSKGLFRNILGYKITGLDQVDLFPIIMAGLGVLVALIIDAPHKSFKTTSEKLMEVMAKESNFMQQTFDRLSAEPVSNSVSTSSSSSSICAAKPTNTDNQCTTTSDAKGQKTTLEPPFVFNVWQYYPKYITEEEVSKINTLLELIKKTSDNLESKSLEDDDTICTICYAHPKSTIFKPCGHSSCKNCISYQMMTNPICFFCKHDIKKVEDLSGKDLHIKASKNSSFGFP